MRPPIIRLALDPEEVVVDNFAGGGGVSTGIEEAIGRSPDYAINHDPMALAMHARNHPTTHHLCENVWKVDPRQLLGKRKCGLAWFSPDCTHHSKARGGIPFRDPVRAKRSRGLAWVVTRWAAQVKPRVIIVENVEEFREWGPVIQERGRCIVDPKRKGKYYRAWRRKLERLGYVVDDRELRASELGAPTSRKRLFVVARRDGRPIVWPVAKFGPKAGKPFRTAAECIDWSIPCPSIFERRTALAENTLRRIARGIQRFVIDAPIPFILPVTHHGDDRCQSVEQPLPTITCAPRGELALAAPFLARIGQAGGNGFYVNDLREPVTTITTKAEHLLIAPSMIQVGWPEREGQAPRCLDIQQPLGTIMAQGNKHGLVAAFLAKHNAGHEATGQQLHFPVDTVTTKDTKALVTSHLMVLHGTAKDGRPVTEPMPTVLAGGTHLAEVRAFLLAYFGKEAEGQQLDLPLRTITTKDRFALVTVAGIDYAIVDIGMRMLTPRELFRAQGFPDDYEIEIGADGKPLTKTAQTRMVGNSVPPPAAREIVLAQFAA